MSRKLRPAIKFTYTIIVGICYIAYVNGLVCLSCNDASDLDDCLTSTATCQDGTEECFLDWHVLPSLQSVFTAGCRSKQVCNLLSSGFGKRGSRRSHVGCSQCCNTPPNSTLFPCNGYLCQQSPAPGPYCGVCNLVSDPQKCSGVSKCPVDQVCSVDMILRNNQIVHRLGCERRTICDVTLKGYKDGHPDKHLTNKRTDGDIVICSACCDGFECNKNKCYTMIKNQTCYNSAICG